MAKDQKRLGRGLSSLISADYSQLANDSLGLPGDGKHTEPRYPANVPIERIRRNPYQPRNTFGEKEMAELVRSIRQSGIIQPLVVRAAGDDWELIVGERRLRAAIQAGLNDVPVVVRAASDEQVLEIALIENIHREDLNAIERAQAYQKYAGEFKLPVEEIAKRVGEDRSTVANYLRLLELSDDIQRLVADRAISMGHARCLLGIVRQEERWELATAVVHSDLSVRALEEIVRRRKQGRVGKEAPATVKPEPRPLVRSIQDQLTGKLGMRVTIRERRQPNTGQIIVEYNSLDDFNRITEKLGLEGE